MAVVPQPDPVATDVDMHIPHSNEPDDKIAIVGLGCRFPGSQGPDDFWVALVNGDDHSASTSPEMLATSNGMLNRCDTTFFEMSTTEARLLDPQHMIILEVCWEALEDAGIAPSSTRGTDVGVFLGLCSAWGRDVGASTRRSDKQLSGLDISANSSAAGAGRVSYFFDWHGPCLPVDTSFSSSLAAVHLAVSSLRKGECPIAIAGGVNLVRSESATVALGNSGVLAPDGRCKAFDASANGYKRSEGCGVIVLERMTDAEKSNHNILAAVIGTSITQDGHTRTLTAPNPHAQQATITGALETSRLNPDDIDYLEAHGTGNAFGDAIELQAISNVFLSSHRERPLFLGSVKTNIGHCEYAAGIAGIIKVALALQHKQIPPHLHFREWNHQADSLSDTALSIPSSVVDWSADSAVNAGAIRRAGVSSFGLSGMNVHAILEDVPQETHDEEMSPSEAQASFLFCVSARSANALDAILNSYSRHLADNAHCVADLCGTLFTGRTHFSDHRFAAYTTSIDGLIQLIEAWRNEDDLASATKSLIISFSDLPSSFPSDWFAHSAAYRAEINEFAQIMTDACALEAAQHLARAVEGLPSSVSSDETRNLLTFCLLCAQGAALRRWGAISCIKAIAGDGIGLLAAAVVATADSCRRRDMMRQVALFLLDSSKNRCTASVSPCLPLLSRDTGDEILPAHTECELNWICNQALTRKPPTVASSSLEECNMWHSDSAWDESADWLCECYKHGHELDWSSIGLDLYPSFTVARLPTYKFDHISIDQQSVISGEATEAVAARSSRFSHVASQADLDVVLSVSIRDIVVGLLGEQRSALITHWDKPFSDLGIDSLLGIDLCSQIADQVGLELPDSTNIYNYPNIHAMASHVSHFIWAKPGRLPVSSSLPSLRTGASTAACDGYRLAITGMACRFPGNCSDPEQYWKLLVDGDDGICDIPSERWPVEQYYDEDPSAAGKHYVRQGGFISGALDFDASFFGMSPREVGLMDPQQRLLLEVVWESIESAGVVPSSLSEAAVGIFVGISSTDFAELASIGGNQYRQTGLSHSVAAGRIAFFLGTKGPCLSIDTACSSSIVATHVACTSVESGESAAAVVAGVNLMLNPETTISFCRANMLSPDGRCKTFDTSADGYVRSEGAAAIHIMPLNDALEQKKEIFAVIRGSSINQDGRSASLTAPSGLSQQKLINQALSTASLCPSQISYVEAHGTGTRLGDPIEMQSISAVFGDDTDRQGRPLYVGSCKTNIGHLEAASGLAGLIKTAMALKKDVIPPHLHLHTLNPLIHLESVPIVIPSTAVPWDVCEGYKRVAGISSFGFSGTNSHVILEEPPKLDVPCGAASQPQKLVICLSARTSDGLKEVARQYADVMEQFSFADINKWKRIVNDICYTSATQRAHFEHRLACIATTPKRMVVQLRHYADNGVLLPSIGHAHVQSDLLTPLAVICYPMEMQDDRDSLLSSETHLRLCRMFEDDISYRETVMECMSHLDDDMKGAVRSLFAARSAEFTQISPSHPVYLVFLFIADYALGTALTECGAQPSSFLGIGRGFILAACHAGVIDIPDAMRLAVKRAELLQHAIFDHGMLVYCGKEELESVLSHADPLQSVSQLALDTFAVGFSDKEGSELLQEACLLNGVRFEKAFVPSQIPGQYRAQWQDLVRSCRMSTSVAASLIGSVDSMSDLGFCEQATYIPLLGSRFSSSQSLKLIEDRGPGGFRSWREPAHPLGGIIAS